MGTVCPADRPPEYLLPLYLHSLKSVEIHWVMAVVERP